MYIEFFDLKENPFRLTPDLDFLFLSHTHSRAMTYMDCSTWNHEGIVVVTGEVGAGKTILIKKFLAELPGSVTVAKIFQTQLDEVEFLQAVLVEFGQNPFNLGKVQLMDMLNTFMIESYSQFNQIVLIVDDAQNLSPRVLEEIRMLSGLETDKEKILNVILVGQPELNETLESPGLEQLLQRIKLRVNIEPLNKSETRGYISHRLQVAGLGKRKLFTEECYPIIYKFTQGIPRLINSLCDTALTVAYADDKKTVGKKNILDSVEELGWKEKKMEKRNQYERIRHCHKIRLLLTWKRTSRHCLKEMTDLQPN